MSFVTRQFQLDHVPSINSFRQLCSVEIHVEGSNSCKQFPLLGAALPIFELPLMAIDEYSNNSAPSCFCKVLNIVIDLENHLFVPNFSFHFDNHVACCVVHNWWICFLVFCVDSLFEELLHVWNWHISWGQKGRYNNNWSRFDRKLSCCFRLEYKRYLLPFVVMMLSSKLLRLYSLSFGINKFTSIAIGPRCLIFSSLYGDDYGLRYLRFFDIFVRHSLVAQQQHLEKVFLRAFKHSCSGMNFLFI